jgi:hypothetical protein
VRDQTDDSVVAGAPVAHAARSLRHLLGGPVPRVFRREDSLAAMEGHSAQQRWPPSQAQELTADIAEVRWFFDRARRARNPGSCVAGGLVLAVPAFHEFRPVRPPNATATVVLFLCAVAVAGAIQTILDLSTPFEGVVRVSVQPLRHALEVTNHG